MCEQCDLAATLRVTQPASDGMLRTAERIPPEAHAMVIDGCRRTTGDTITEEIALNLVLNLAAALGIVPQRGAAEEFLITDCRDGSVMDIEAVPPIPRATARMLMAVRAGDLLAARDVYRAFVATYPDQVTPFLLSVMKDIYANVRPDR